MLSGIGKYAVHADKKGGDVIQINAALSNQSGASNGGLSSGATVTSSAATGLYEKDILQGFINTRDENMQRRIFRDMYEHDAISGAAVDLISELPFSDFTLSSLPDQEMLLKFAKSLEAINVKSFLPEQSHEFLVIGCTIASLNFDDRLKMFTSIMPHNRDWCHLTPLPLYGRDPVIDLQIPPEIKKLLNSPDPRIREAFDKWGKEWEEMGKDKLYPLPPDRTLYLARKTFSTTSLGTSYFNRLLPIWLMEKALLRGTIELAYKRQRSLLQLVVGDEDWEPNNQELIQFVQSFMQADVDPVGGIIATRPGVQANEIRQGGDFWRYDEMYDFFCLSRGSFIPTDAGILPIENITNISNTKILGGKGISKPCKLIEAGKKHTLKIKLFNGLETKPANKHKFMIIGRLNDIKWLKAEDLRVGDSLCIATKPCTSSTPLNIGNFNPINYGNEGCINIPKKMNPDLAFIMGLLVAEGCHDKYVTTFYNSDQKLNKIYENRVKKVFNINAIAKEYVSKNNYARTKCAYRSRISSRILSDFWDYLGVKNVRSKNKTPSYYKEVPWSILQADKESQLAYLAAYVEGDGHITERLINISSFSKKNLRQMQIMLLSHGYVSHINKSSHSLTLNTHSAKAFYTAIKPYMVCKKRKNNYTPKTPEGTCGIPTQAIRDLLKNRRTGPHTFSDDKGKEVYIEFTNILNREKRVFWHYEGFKSGQYNEQLSILKQVSTLMYNNTLDLFERKFFYSPIVSIKDNGMQECYDLCMEKGHEESFVANGIVVHNSSAKMRGLGISDAFLCMSGESYIQTDLGLKPVKEMIGRRYNNKFIYDNTKIEKNKAKKLKVSYRSNSFFKNNGINNWVYSGVKPTKKLISRYKYQFVGTDEHKIFVLNSDMMIVEKQVGNIDVASDRLCLPTNSYVRTTPLSIKRHLGKTDLVNKHCTNKKKIKYPNFMTPQLAFNIGLIVSEGTFDNYCVRVCNSDLNLINTYKENMKTVFSCNTVVKEQKLLEDRYYNETLIKSNKLIYNAANHSKAICRALFGLGLYNKKHIENKGASWKKIIPWSIMEADGASQLAFIAAYIEGDGSLNNRSITIISRSSKLLHQMQTLLASHGVISNILHKKYYKLIVNKRFAAILYQKIKPFMVTKKADLTMQYEHDNHGVPTKYLKSWIIENTIQTTRWGTQFKTECGSTVFINNFASVVGKHVGNYLSYSEYQRGDYNEFLLFLSRISPTMYGKILALLNQPQEFFFEPIKEIKKHKNIKTYDLMMHNNGSHSFVANGLLVHNSADATFSNMETSLSVFLDQLRAYRDMITRKIFYQRLFPIIALENNFRISSNTEVSGSATRNPYGIRRKRRNGVEDFSVVIGGDRPRLINRHMLDGSSRTPVLADDNESFDVTQFYMPKLQWHKTLKPEADSAYLDILVNLSQQGVPIPLRVWAAAGGQSITELMGSLKEDSKLRNKVAKYQESLPMSPQDQASQMMQQSQASTKIGLLNRDFSGVELRDARTHKVLSKKGRIVQDERVNKNAAMAMANLARKENYQTKLDAEGARKRIYHHRKNASSVSSVKSHIFGILD